MEHTKVFGWMPALFKKLLTMQSRGVLCDAVIECDNSEELPVHSCVLAAASPVFQEALAEHKTQLIGQHKVFQGQDFSKHVWTVFMKFTYSGYLRTDLNREDLMSLNKIAKRLSINSLEEELVSLLAENTEDIKVEQEGLDTKCDELFQQHMMPLQDEDMLSQRESSVEKDVGYHVAGAQNTKTENNESKEKQSLKCRHCTLTFTSSAILEEHCKAHHFKYECSHCQKCFQKKNSLVLHEKMAHVQPKEEFECKHCKFVTKNSALYLVHLKTHKQYKCTYCSYEGKSKAILMSHLKEEHQYQKLHKCSFNRCSYSSNSEYSIKAHEASVHTTERSFKCTSCSKLFKSQADLNRHSSIHSHEYTCDQCGASFARKFSLEDHRRKKHGAEPLTCPECDAVFTSMPLRSKHIREIHQGRMTKYKRCPCKLCGKVVKNMGELRRHMRVHTGEKLHPCDSCSRSFATKNDLLNHKMIHTGEKPFMCVYCSFRCNRAYNLQIHEKKHQQERDTSIVCSVCQPEVSFKCLDDLEKHKLKEHNVNLHAENMDTSMQGVNIQETSSNLNYETVTEVMVFANEQGETEDGQGILVPMDQLFEGGHMSNDNTTQMVISNGKILTHVNQLGENVPAGEENPLLGYIEGYNGAENILTYVQESNTLVESDQTQQILITEEQSLTSVDQSQNSALLHAIAHGDYTIDNGENMVMLYEDAYADEHGVVLPQ